MCSPHDSSRWVQDYDKLMKRDVIPIVKEQMSWDKDTFNNTWYENPDFWDQIYQQIPNLKQVYFAGGEPLMNKTHFKWLDKLTNTKDTQLLYNTNGTFRPTREEINIWKKFRGIWLSFSIDSYGKKFEELRVGAKWDEVLANLKYCQEEIVNREFDNNSNCSVVMTVSKFNVMDVFDLYRIITDNIDFNHSEPVNFNYLYYPESMSCHNMEKSEIEKVVKYYDLNIPTLNPSTKMYKQSKDLRDSLITFLEK